MGKSTSERIAMAFVFRPQPYEGEEVNGSCHVCKNQSTRRTSLLVFKITALGGHDSESNHHTRNNAQTPEVAGKAVISWSLIKPCTSYEAVTILCLMIQNTTPVTSYIRLRREKSVTHRSRMCTALCSEDASSDLSVGMLWDIALV